MSINLQRSEILRILGRDLGWAREPSFWDERQHADADDMLTLGVLQFYSPMILPGERSQHEWTFLTPWTTIVTAASQSDYDLPEDFGGLTDDITFLSENTGPCPIKIVSDSMIRRYQQRSQNVTGFPEYACIMPSPSDGSRPQAWQITFAPTPSGIYELRMRYRSNPSQIIDSAPYPLGGQPTADALIASVLCAAESKLNDTQGVRYMEYVEKLRAAVAWDRSHNLQSLGYCGDRSVSSYDDEYQPSTRIYLNGVEL